MATVITEPVTREQAREATRALGLTDSKVDDLIQAAREAAEDYTHIKIALRTTTTGGVVTTEGYAPGDCPACIKEALYLYMVARHEMHATEDWLKSFHDLLYPRRSVLCD